MSAMSLRDIRTDICVRRAYLSTCPNDWTIYNGNAKACGVVIPKVLLPGTRVKPPSITRSKCDMARTPLNLGRPIRTTITIGRMPVQIVTAR